MSTQMLPFHDHPLEISQSEYSDIATYWCRECELELRKKWVDEFLSHPIHRTHSFKFWSADVRYSCHFCRDDACRSFARCTVCNIIVDEYCMGDMPPRTISQPKHHEHSFTLLMRLVTFPCNACGVEDDRNPYVCLECDLMVHKECLELPRVIMINRHDHRISHTFHLGQGSIEGVDWRCGVCRKAIDWLYGAFKCSRCPMYAVHSRCAVRREVWDRIELEDVPEEEEEIEDPFKVINENGDIIHFSHETENHILLRLDDNCVAEVVFFPSTVTRVTNAWSAILSFIKRVQIFLGRNNISYTITNSFYKLTRMPFIVKLVKALRMVSDTLVLKTFAKITDFGMMFGAVPRRSHFAMTCILNILCTGLWKVPHNVRLASKKLRTLFAA